jgi:hypothetical protein
MTPREAFKIGFVKSCLAAGLKTAEEIEKRAEQAEAVLVKRAGMHGVMGIADAPVAFARKYRGPLMIGAPLALGAAAGYGASKLTAPDVTPEEVRQQELIDELRHWTRRARESAKHKAVRLAPLSGGTGGDW